MKLAPEAHAHAEAFFRNFNGSSSLHLPHIKLLHGWLIDLVLRYVLNVDALTLGRRVFVRARVFSRDEAGRKVMSADLLMHELMHVGQYEQAGMGRFLWAYMRQYASGLWRERSIDAEARRRAYLDLRYEREARAAESAYQVWRALRDGVNASPAAGAVDAARPADA